MNPVVEMRSGLGTFSWFEPDRPWHVQVTSEYGSLIEYAPGQPEEFVLDAELFSTRVVVARAITTRGFLLAGTSWTRAGDGHLDGLLDASHELLGVRVAGRDKRPENAFAYRMALGEQEFQYEKGNGFLGDLRVGLGLRHRVGWQTVFSLTVPTGAEPDGFRKRVVSGNLTTTFHRDFGEGGRFGYEGTLGLGYTPRHGELEEWQRTTFFLLAQGVRARLIGPWQGYANFFLVSPYYRNTGIPEFNLQEMTLDLGALIRLADGPTWFLGMTQDLLPNGPAVDVVFRVGAYW
jgi:hypothetical protein